MTFPNTYIFYQDKNIHKTEGALTTEFSTLCECFADDKLSIHFRKDKKKQSVFFLPKLSVCQSSI